MLTRDELVRQYSSGRVAIVPSFFEGFGFPASEAMACGLPVIANAAGALPEVVGTDGHAGLLVPRATPGPWRTPWRRSCSKPGKAERMGRAARRRVEHVFRWDDAAHNLVQGLRGNDSCYSPSISSGLTSRGATWFSTRAAARDAIASAC